MNKYLLIACILVSFGCNNDPIFRKQYYANLTGVVSPYLNYTHQGEINKNQADSIGSYYTFLYKNDTLAEILFYKRNRPSAQSYFRSHKVKFTYAKDSYTRSYYDENGDKAIMWRHYYQGGNIHQEEFFLDKQGKKSSLVLKDSVGRQISSGDGVYRYEWSHLSEDEVIQEHFDSIGNPTVFRKDIPFERLILKTDQNGFSSTLTRINDKDLSENHPTEGYATLKLLFDKFGNELGWEHRDENMQMVNLPNEFGHAQWLYNKQFREKSLGIMESYSESYYDKDGIRVQNEDSIHQVRYELNKYGDLRSLEYYNAQLGKQSHITNGFFRATIAYDTLGNRSSISKYNTNDHLIK